MPQILTTALVMLSFVDLSPFLPASLTSAYTSLVPSILPSTLSSLAVAAPTTLALSVPIALSYVLFYLYLTSANFVGLTASLFVSACWYASLLWVGSQGDASFTPALVVHVVGWVAQFYGHGAHEGRAPALFQNLFQALFVAFLFVWIEVLIGVGLLGDFDRAISPIVEAEVKKWKEGKGKKGK